MHIKLLISSSFLERKKNDERFNELIKHFNNEIGEPIEVVNSKNDPPSTYYLSFERDFYQTRNENETGEKIFLMNINRPDDSIIENYSPAGFIDLRNYMSKTPTIYGIKNVLEYGQIENLGAFKCFDYNSVVLFKKDGTYKPIVKSIIKYLKMYDSYLSRNKR